MAIQHSNLLNLPTMDNLERDPKAIVKDEPHKLDFIEDLLRNEEDPELQKKQKEVREFKELVDSLIVRHTDNIEKTPTVLEISGKIYGTLGNLSLISGKSKSKKTMLVALLVTGVLSSGEVEEITSIEQGKRVLYFDTEQSPYHANLQTKRIFTLSKNNDNLLYLALREEGTKERAKIIKRIINESENTALVIIDGIADLLSEGVNDEKGAIELVDELMRFSSAKNIHIISVLHHNKTSTNAKGHIGSLLEQKSETVLAVSKDDNNDNISKVEASLSRNAGLDTFYIEVDEHGIPFLTEEPLGSSIGEDKRKSSNPHKYDMHLNYLIVKEVFKDKIELGAGELKENLCYVLGKYDRPCSDKPVRDFLHYLIEKNMISQDEKFKPYKLNKKWELEHLT